MLYQVTFHMTINTHQCNNIKALESMNTFMYPCIRAKGDQ